ncbi:MAG TPA: hypothetical protein VGF84_13695 [Micromonosporaceae bacterium]|jgi:hypothetical protein
MPASVTRVEEVYRIARDLADRRDIAAARGFEATDLPILAETAADDFRDALDALTAEALAADGDDRTAIDTMRAWSRQSRNPDRAPDAFDECSSRIEDGYAAAQATVDTDGGTATRLAILERLSTDDDPERRRRLFHALAPVWATIDGDGSPDGSPYQRELLPLSRRRWSAGRSPVAANARALGIDPGTIEASLVAILETWRGAFAGGPPLEPWDWWHEAGAANRALAAATPLERIAQISDAYHASLGADPAVLDIGFDLTPRAGRPPVPVAYTEFGGRPGPHRRAKAWVMASYTSGGLGELTELVHETGHAIHIAAIDTRPAFADWPDSDAFTEAIAEITALDTAEPRWQEHWLGSSVPAWTSLRGRYADVMLDICWALLEIRLHADESARPNDVWTALTSTYLGIVAHPELSWWAMRGQLVQEPGYMVNYALGPILAADMRAAIRAVRGDWTHGDLGWYGWVSDHVYRYGLEHSSGRVLADLLGRRPRESALVHEIRRGIR